MPSWVAEVDAASGRWDCDELRLNDAVVGERENVGMDRLDDDPKGPVLAGRQLSIGNWRI